MLQLLHAPWTSDFKSCMGMLEEMAMEGVSGRQKVGEFYHNLRRNNEEDKERVKEEGMYIHRHHSVACH